VVASGPKTVNLPDDMDCRWSNQRQMLHIFAYISKNVILLVAALPFGL